MRVRIGSILHTYTGGETEVDAAGATVGDVLDDLERRFPGLKFRIVDEQDRIREHVNVFVGRERARELVHPVQDDEIYIVGALSGG